MKKLIFALSLSAFCTVAFAQEKGEKEKTKKESKKDKKKSDEKFENVEKMYLSPENSNLDCQLNIAPLEKNVDLNGNDPDYFFKPIPEQGPTDKRDDVSLILGGGNYVMNMKTGKLDQIPGPYDGVPTPDGEFIVSPANGGHITFFDRNGLNMKSKDVYDDASSKEETLNGVYHSLGVLNREDRADGSKTITYRAITDTITTSGESETRNTMEFKEYTFEISATGEKKLTGTNGAPQLLCSNYPKHMMKTPIISKDGKMLSVYNMETGTSIIYDIVKNKDGKSECKTKKDMGFAASKMEFSPDGKKVVFAMNSLSTTPSKVDWYEVPDTNTHNMNVYTYDFKSDDLNKVSSQPSGNAYYPSFSNNGDSVVYMAQEAGDKGMKYGVKRIALKDSPSMKNVDFSQMRECKLTDDTTISMLAIGKLWEGVCSNLKSDMTVSALATLPLSLSKASCEKLVQGYWKTYTSGVDLAGSKLVMDVGTDNNKSALSGSDNSFYINKLMALDVEKLTQTCQTLKGETAKKQPKVVLANTAEPIKKANPVQSCTQCHSSGERYIPFDKPEELGPWKKKMLLHVFTGNMPKNMNLAPKERTELIEYLESIDDLGVDQKK